MSLCNKLQTQKKKASLTGDQDQIGHIQRWQLRGYLELNKLFRAWLPHFLYVSFISPLNDSPQTQHRFTADSHIKSYSALGPAFLYVWLFRHPMIHRRLNKDSPHTHATQTLTRLTCRTPRPPPRDRPQPHIMQTSSKDAAAEIAKATDTEKIEKI